MQQTTAMDGCASNMQSAHIQRLLAALPLFDECTRVGCEPLREYKEARGYEHMQPHNCLMLLSVLFSFIAVAVHMWETARSQPH